MAVTPAIEMFYDGECPLCMRETKMLSRLDRHNRIQFTNIASPQFNPAFVGKTNAELMAEMHGRLPDGSWVTGVEVFRRLYAAVGFTPIVLVTRLPIIRHLLDAGYHVFAKYRLRLTGRCDTGCSVQTTEVGS